MTAVKGYARDKTVVAAVTVTVCPGVKWISANDRSSWHVRAELTRAWLKATSVLIAAQRPAPIPAPVEVFILVHRTSNRRSDAPNVAPTAKACVDGAVAAGLLTDDNDKVIVRTIFERGSNRPQPALTITFRPTTRTKETR